MSDLTDAIRYLENDVQYLKDNLPNLDDPPTRDQLELVQAFIPESERRSATRARISGRSRRHPEKA